MSEIFGGHIPPDQREVQTLPNNAEIKSVSNQLSEILQTEGVEAQVVNVSNAGEFSEVILLPKKEAPREQTVRVYRGVRNLDASVVNQTPYAMRADTQEGFGQKILSDTEAEVISLADEPTYDRLIDYTDKVKQHLIPEQREKMDRELKKIEDGILEGYSLRTELKYNQIRHTGGVLDSGLSPYLSASWNAEDALLYAGENGAVLVIDVPISKIEDFGEDVSETNIKGIISPEDISAIIVSNGRKETDKEERSRLFSTAIGAINDSVQVSRHQESEVGNVRKYQIDSAKKFDEQQRILDVKSIRQKRANELITRFPEVDSSIEDNQENSKILDDYDKAQTKIFDFYSQRLSELGRNLDDLSYEPKTEYGTRKPFNRDQISDEMLYKMRAIVQQIEQRKTRQY